MRPNTVVALGVTTVLAALAASGTELAAAEPASAAVKHAVQANSDFAFDLYRQLAKENAGKNLFFSPYSVSSALAMTAEGARGQTALEMGKALRFDKALLRAGDGAKARPWRMSPIHAGLGELSSRLTGEDKAADRAARARIAALRKQHQAANALLDALFKQRKSGDVLQAAVKQKALTDKLNEALAKVDRYELRIANALWGEKTYPFLKDYVETISKHYKTDGVFPADFRNNFPAERDRVNQWVAEQTRNRIKDIIPQLPPGQAKLIRLILTNAIYFKGEWSEPFKEAATKSGDFTLAGGKTTRVPIMHAWGLKVGRYAAFNADGSAFQPPRQIRGGRKTSLYPGEDGFAMVELPYKGGELAMVVIAPNSPDGLGAVENLRTAEALAGWVGKLKKRRVHVFLPRFKLETKYLLNATLQAMGMVRAFVDPLGDPIRGADFGGMCASRDPRDKLCISKVLHKAFVEVNEKGTEAAAATAVMLAMGGAMPRDVPFTPTFKADRPFVFVIRDCATGGVLFVGRMTDPAAK